MRTPLLLLLLACEPRYDTVEWAEIPVACGSVWRACYRRDDDPDWQRCYITDGESWQVGCEWPCEEEADATCGPRPPAG